jgi:hypothetical protein
MSKPFTKLPNILVWNDYEETIIEATNNKALVTLLGLMRGVDYIRDQCYTSIGLILTISELQIDKRYTNEVKDVLIYLWENKIIKSKTNLMKIKTNDIIKVTDNLLFSGGFFMIDDEDIDVIIQTTQDIKTKLGILNVFCFYLSTCGRSEIRNCGQHLCSYHSRENVSRCLNITEKTVTKYLKQLEELNLVRYKHYTIIKEEKTKTVVKNTPNFVTIVKNKQCNNDTRLALNQYKHNIKNSGWKILD